MNQEQILALAREAGAEFAELPMTDAWLFTDNQQLERFAALVAAHEREACAKVCEEYADKCLEAEDWEAEDVSVHCATAIRARGEK